jgi:predicted RNase H-like HicB family nuclease
MDSPRPSFTSAAITYKSLEDGSWSASLETPAGTMTATGVSMDDAHAALRKLFDAWAETASRDAARREPTN